MNENNKKSSMFAGVILGSVITGIILLIVFTIILSRVTKKYTESIEQVYGYVTPDTTDTTGDGEIIDDNTALKIQAMYNRLATYFYYTENLDADKIREAIFDGIMSSLDDKYAEYYNPEEFASLFEDSEGIYYGIGSYVQKHEPTDCIELTGIFDGSPAKAAGLRDGDVVVEVDGDSISGLTLTESVNLIKGPENTDVVLTVMRSGEKDYLHITVTRGRVESPTIVYEMKEDKIGYIQITEFDEITTTQFSSAYKDLNDQGMKALIIDLRSNGGGNLDTVLAISEELLPEGLITYTEDKNGKRDEYRATGANEIQIPVVVLTNEYTASASELLTGALRDYNKATIIGTNTFGKGIVQTIMPLNDGSGMKFTTSSYFTPNGECIQGKGIAPDIELKFDSELYYGEEKRDNQIEYAIDYLKKKIN